MKYRILFHIRDLGGAKAIRTINTMINTTSILDDHERSVAHIYKVLSLRLILEFEPTVAQTQDNNGAYQVANTSFGTFL